MTPHASKLLVRVLAAALMVTAAWAWRSHANHLPAPCAAEAAPPAGEVAPAAAPERGARDPRADLEGQMQWDPATRTYHGG